MNPLWLLTALTVLKWIVLAVLVLLFLLLILPMGVLLEQESGSFRVSFMVFGIKIAVYPREPRKKTKPKPKKKNADRKPAQERKKASSKKNMLNLSPQTVKELILTAGWAGQFLLRRLKIRNIRFLRIVHGEDAAETALGYGRTMAAAHAGRGALENVLNLQFDEFNVLPDFTGERNSEGHFSCKITAQLYIMIVIAVYGIVRILRSGVFSDKQGGKKNGKPRNSRADGYHDGQNPGAGSDQYHHR